MYCSLNNYVSFVMEYDDDDCLANRSTPHKTLVYASFLHALE